MLKAQRGALLNMFQRLQEGNFIHGVGGNSAFSLSHISGKIQGLPHV